MTDVHDVVAAAYRSDWGRIVAGLIRLTGDWTVAEDATQDAFATALARWPADGVPDRPAAWLTTAARNRAIDLLRGATTRQSKSALLEVANLHVALSIDNCEFVETHHPLYYRGLVGDPLAIDADGCRRLPDGPGLGVALDMDWIDDHTVETITTPST